MDAIAMSACFRMKAVRPFFLDGKRYESGDYVYLDSLSIVNNLTHRGLVTQVPMPVNGEDLETAPAPSSLQ